MFARWDRMAKQFTRIGKEIVIAVKAGGPDSSTNPALRRCMQNAKSELQETLLWESANGGENDISRERKRDLNTRIRETDEQIRCMVNPDAVGC